MFKLKPLAALSLLTSLLLAQTGIAQDEELETTTIDAVAQDSANAELPRGELEEIVVTGSRLRSSTYTSISPLQIIDAEFQREVGLINADDILQNSTNAGGQQIDLTFNGFVLDNGPGSTTVSLRGLGANRTLLLMNGRRLAPSGVEGAPSSPSVNLVPRLMVQRYENLLDAGSSIYGSDAIAGASNIITRKDFDGLEIQVFSGTYDRPGGDNSTIGAAWGFNTDRGSFGIGVEYTDVDRTSYADRPWTNECTGNVEIDQNGNIRRQDQYYAQLGYPDVGQCSSLSLAARTLVRGSRFGSIYYTPGSSNGGWGNFTESGDPFTGLAADGDGDVYFYQLIAELASRSNGRFIVVGILHQTFQEYAATASKKIRDEWGKVHGRFVDISINLSSSEPDPEILANHGRFDKSSAWDKRYAVILLLLFGSSRILKSLIL